MLAGVGHIHPKMLVGPSDARCFHGLAIREESFSSLSADDSVQRRGSSSLTISLLYLSLYLETVAGGAELIEDTLSDLRISGRNNHVGFLDSFLLGRHLLK